MTIATATRTCEFGLCDREAVNHVEVVYAANPETGRESFTWVTDECLRCTAAELVAAEVNHATITVTPL